MACGCGRRTKKEYVWISEDGTRTHVFSHPTQAAAYAKRKGGRVETREKS